MENSGKGKFSENWTDPVIVQQAVAHLQWRSIHNRRQRRRLK